MRTLTLLGGNCLPVSAGFHLHSQGFNIGWNQAIALEFFAPASRALVEAQSNPDPRRYTEPSIGGIITLADHNHYR